MTTNGSLLLRSLLVASLPAMAAQAQAPAPAAAPAATPAPLPAPAPEVQRLAFLIGDWVHEETFQPGPMGPGGTGRGRSKSALVLGDHYVYTIYTTNTPMGKLEARGFFGWDGEKKHYTMSWFDNMGMATDFTGTFDAEGALVMNAEYTHQGTPIKERFSIRRQADGKLVFQSAMPGPDGSWKTAMESVATAAAK